MVADTCGALLLPTRLPGTDGVGVRAHGELGRRDADARVSHGLCRTPRAGVDIGADADDIRPRARRRTLRGGRWCRPRQPLASLATSAPKRDRLMRDDEPNVGGAGEAIVEHL